jgi:hypothetical protein
MRHLSTLLVLGAVGVSLGCEALPPTADAQARHDGVRAIQQATTEEVDADQMQGAIEEPPEAEEGTTASAEPMASVAPTTMMSENRQIQQRRFWGRGRGRWARGGWYQNRWFGRRFWRNTWWDPFFSGTRVVYVRVPTVIY